MIENDAIQTRGFHNVRNAGGETVGFQFCMSPRYYRGLWLSQFRTGDVIVDDEHYAQDAVRWELRGVDYTIEQMRSQGHVWWQLTDLATVKVDRPGGLEQGYHEVVLHFGWICNYIAEDREDPDYGVNFKGFEHRKRLLLV